MLRAFRIYGLYATIVPLLAYAAFGPSRILVLGLIFALAAFILAVVPPLSGGDPLRAVALASMMAVVSGVVCIIAGLARLGFITELLSKPICYGYINGIALTVLTSQLPKLCFQSKTPDRFATFGRLPNPCLVAPQTGSHSSSVRARSQSSLT